MKYLVRIWLTIECFVFLLLFTKDLEAMLEYGKFLGTSPTAEEWVWLFFSTIVPMISMAIAAYYSFKLSWENRVWLAVAVAVYTVFVLFAQLLSRTLPLGYVTVPAYVSLPLVAAYIACIFIPQIPHRRWISFGAMLVLGVGLIIAYAIAKQWDGVAAWTPVYVFPLIPLALLGRMLPEKPVEHKTVTAKKKHK